MKKNKYSTRDIDYTFNNWIETGDMKYYNEIFNHFKPRLYYYLISKNKKTDINKGLSYDEIHDVIIDVLTKIYTKKHLFNKEYKISTWVFTIANRSFLHFTYYKNKNNYVFKSSITNEYNDEYFEEYIMNNISENVEYLTYNNFEFDLEYKESANKQDMLIDKIKEYLKTQKQIKYSWTYDILFNKKITYNDIAKLENKSQMTIRYHVNNVLKDIKNKFYKNYEDYKIASVC